MKVKKEQTAVPARLTADQLRRLYERLEDEATPYALRVSKGEKHLKPVTIYCDADSVAYFKNILEHEIQTEI